jgi:acyl-coenzyme A thioesterase PaaI-like protein
MAAPFQYDVVDLTDAELTEERRVYGGLAQSVRDLAEASLRSTVAPDELEAIRAEVDALTQRLRKSQLEGSFGVSLTRGGAVRGYGNAVVGLRNPVAVPLDVQRSPEGRAWADFELNALYEGPPTKVHGGVIALVLDQIFGEAAAAGGTPGMTGTLTLRYLKNTPLGRCAAEAWVDRREGVKTYVHGVMRDADGDVTVEGEGIFILPRWAREALEGDGMSPPQFE